MYLSPVPDTWIVTDEHWSLPVAVEFPEQTDVAAVRFLPGFPLLGIQRDALAAKLNSAGKYRDEVWWILRTVLQAIALQTTEDPERLLLWRPTEARVKYRTDPKSTNRDEFFAQMARMSIVNDPVKCEVLWVSFMKVALSWMLNSQRPVPMGFCDLYAVPYQPNWKSQLFGTLRQRRALGDRSMPKFTSKELLASTPEKLIKNNVPDEMLNPQLLFWCKKDDHMYWSIEARPRNMWWRMIKAVELAKKKKRRGAAYVVGVADTMKRLLPQTLELYASWLQQVTLPCVRLATYRDYRRGAFLSRLKKKVLRKAELPNNSFAQMGNEARTPNVVLDDVSSAAFLSALPDIQRERLAMRNAGADMERSLAHDRKGDQGNGIPHPEIGTPP